MTSHVNLKFDYDCLKNAIDTCSLDDMMKSALVIILNDFMGQEKESFIPMRSNERFSLNQNTGADYYEREVSLSPGRFRIKFPITTSGELATQAIERYSLRERALILAIIEMVINGVANRKIEKRMKELFRNKLSNETYSALIQQIDPVIKKWSERSLCDKFFRYVYVDSMNVKLRENNKVVSKLVYIAMGINEGDKRELLGLKIGNMESLTNWKVFFESLVLRGLKPPKLVISNRYSGLKAAVRNTFVGSTWQYCTVSFINTIINSTDQEDSLELRRQLSEVFRATNIDEARQFKLEFTDNYDGRKGYEKALEILDEGFEDAIPFLLEPLPYHVNLRTTNVLERINQELRRRERVIGIFPNQQSVFRLMAAVLMDLEETFDRGGRTFLRGKLKHVD